VQGYTYYTSFVLGLCEGPMGGYVTTFLNQQYIFGLNGSGLEVSTGGATPQTPWGYLSANFPAQALGYNGLAYVGAFNYNLGSSPNLPQFSFVLNGISGIKAGNVLNGRDSDPALIIQDFLTNTLAVSPVRPTLNDVAPVIAVVTRHDTPRIRHGFGKVIVETTIAPESPEISCSWHANWIMPPCEVLVVASTAATAHAGDVPFGVKPPIVAPSWTNKPCVSVLTKTSPSAP
jgi:hypothetical protein